MSDSVKSRADEAAAHGVLMQRPKEQYGERYNDHLLEQYELSVQMADHVSDRRSSSNQFFLAANSVLVSLVALAFGTQRANLDIVGTTVRLSAVVGMLFSLVWFFVIDSYRRINTAKFAVINKLERALPAAPFSEEWRLLASPDNGGRRRLVRAHLPLSTVESVVPVGFLVLYLLLFFLTFV